MSIARVESDLLDGELFLEGIQFNANLDEREAGYFCGGKFVRSIFDNVISITYAPRLET
jgi:hypothetical protein